MVGQLTAEPTQDWVTEQLRLWKFGNLKLRLGSTPENLELKLTAARLRVCEMVSCYRMR